MRRGVDHPTPEWEQGHQAAAGRWAHLASGSTDRLRDVAWSLTRRVRWEGLDSFAVTPAVQGRIATEGSIICLEIDDRLLGDVSAILVAPTAQDRQTRFNRGGPIVSERPAHILGEALLHGPMRFAWDQVAADLGRDQSVVIHEFAHKLDMADGLVDGEPPLGRDDSLRLERIMSDAMDSLAMRPQPQVLPVYALTNVAEFFACATEAFFVRPETLRKSLPDLYVELKALYVQEPIFAELR